MLLVTCNSQGELTPLEIGIHALGAVGKAKGGKGKKGGLKQYSELIGRTHQYLSQFVAAAEVCLHEHAHGVLRAGVADEP